MQRLIMPLMPSDRGYSGIYTYMERISRALLASAPEGWEVRFPVLRGDRRLYPEIPADLFLEVDDRHGTSLSSATWHMVHLPRALRAWRANALLLPAGNRRVCPLAPVPMVMVVHDLNDLEVSWRVDRLRSVYGRLLGKALKGADWVVAVSGRTAEQVARLGVPGKRIRVIRNGVDHERFAAPSPGEVRATLGVLRLEPGYLLYVSRIEHPAKGHRNLLDAYAILRDRHPNAPPLVLAGKDWHGAEVVHHRAEAPDVRNHVRFTGYVAEENLPALYAGARALVFPSLAEGFGLPLLEAMAAGCPVLCSDRPPMNEIVGEAAYVFEPEYPEGIADGMECVLLNEGFREELIQRGHQRVLRFTWEVTARSLWRLVQGTE